MWIERDSVNIQIICESAHSADKCRCRWPEGTHDSFIVQNSSVGLRLQGDAVEDGWLIGERYPISLKCRWSGLSTEAMANNDPTQRPNRSAIITGLAARTRAIVERTSPIVERTSLLVWHGPDAEHPPPNAAAIQSRGSYSSFKYVYPCKVLI